MNIKRTLDKNYKTIFYSILIIIFIIVVIRLLNYYYEEQEKERQIELKEIIAEQEKDESELTEEDFNVESDSVVKAMRSFVKYCNEKKTEKAYRMLTDDCKDVLYPTIEEFKESYINVVYNIQRDYEIKEMYISRNTEVYLVTLYEDMLATGGLGDIRYEYYTFTKDKNDIYKISVNNFISRVNKNKETTVDGIKIKIGQVDIYSEFQETEITIINETSKIVNFTGKRMDNILLQNSRGANYFSLNSEFENDQVIIEPNESRKFTVTFNKYYNLGNDAKYLIFPNVIMDYDEFLKSENKQNYNKMNTIKISY